MTGTFELNPEMHQHIERRFVSQATKLLHIALPLDDSRTMLVSERDAIDAENLSFVSLHEQKSVERKVVRYWEE